MKAIWRNRVDVVAVSGPVADAIDDLVSANNTQPIELSLPNSTTTKIHAGTGSPEGVIVGSVGDIWLRTDGTTSTTVLYWKTSGKNTKTGWVFTGQWAFPLIQNPSTDATTLDDYRENNWTPIDSSGAGLTFTVTSATYIKVGQLVFVQFHLAFPVTASGAQVSIGGLPFTPASFGALSVGFSNSAVGAMTVRIHGTTAVDVWTAVGGAVTNANLSNTTFVCAGTYRATV